MAVVSVGDVPARRKGVGHWTHGFRRMLRWEITRARLLLPILIVVQAFTGTGLVLGIGLFFQDMPSRTIQYLASGAVVISLVTVGLVLGPQLIAQQRQSGSYDFISSFPVPRSAAVAAWAAFNLMIALPGMAAAVLVAMWRYDAAFTLSWMVVPATALILAAATMIGQAYGAAIPEPRIIGLVSQVLIFVVFGFSPISYPAENLPSWFADLHQYLPFLHMGNLMRAGLTEGLASHVVRSFLVLGVWTALATSLAGWVMRRRP